MAVTTFTISKSTSQVVSNMDLRRATLQAAALGNEQAMSSTRIIKFPGSPVTDPATNRLGNTITVDVTDTYEPRFLALLGIDHLDVTGTATARLVRSLGGTEQ